MKVWIKAGVIIFYVLIYSFLRKRMRRDFIKFFSNDAIDDFYTISVTRSNYNKAIRAGFSS